MLQRFAAAARAMVRGRVESNHGSAFGESIAFEHRQAELPGLVDQRGRNACAPDGDEAQAGRRLPTAPRHGHQRFQ
ncbi:hypothetical protein D3C83_45800 [compost metagenome]